ncbi:MAG: hypothetical protein WAM60_20420 [Candidatus Promineifilaceae bacterium]
MSYPSNLNPAAEAEAVTPSDSANIDPTRGIYVGTSGDLRVMMLNGDIVTFSSLAAGIVHPLQVVRVYSTSTTASEIVALR